METSPPAGVQLTSSKLDELVRDLEGASMLDPIAAAATKVVAPFGRGRARELLSGRALGHALHPMLTDLPIGFWTSSFVLDIIGGRAGRAASQRFIALGLVSVPVTAWTGWSDWLAATQPSAPGATSDAASDVPAVRRVGITHASLNGAAAVAYAASYRARRRDRYGRGVAYGMLGAAFATVAGHLGGHLVFRLGVSVVDPTLSPSVGVS